MSTGRWWKVGKLHVLAVALLVSGASLSGCDPVVTRTLSTYDQNVEYTSWRALEYIIDNGGRPTSVALQELCEDSLTSVRELLFNETDDYDGGAFYQPSNFKRPQCAGNNPFGEEPAARQIVAVADYGDYAISGAFPTRRAGQVNGYVCHKSPANGTHYWACSTHLESMDASINITQGEYLLNRVRSRFGFSPKGPVIVSGDFNRRPDEDPVNVWQQYFFEVDQSSPNEGRYTNPNPSVTKKIDYTFVIRDDGDAAYGVGEVGCATDSDHCYLQGYVRFHADDP